MQCRGCHPSLTISNYQLQNKAMQCNWNDHSISFAMPQEAMESKQSKAKECQQSKASKAMQTNRNEAKSSQVKHAKKTKRYISLPA